MSSYQADSVKMRRRYKLHHRTAPIVFAFFMAAIMAFLMSATIASVNGGITADLPRRTLEAYTVAMPVAFMCVMLVRPVVVRIVALLVHPASREQRRMVHCSNSAGPGVKRVLYTRPHP
jgi:Protein of unknown function (DUF2798)